MHTTFFAYVLICLLYFPAMGSKYVKDTKFGPEVYFVVFVCGGSGDGMKQYKINFKYCNYFVIFFLEW